MRVVTKSETEQAPEPEPKAEPKAEPKSEPKAKSRPSGVKTSAGVDSVEVEAK